MTNSERENEEVNQPASHMFLTQMEEEIHQLEEKLNKTLKEHKSVHEQFEQIQSSTLFSLTKLSTWKKTVRTIASYLLGRRNWKRLYSQTYKSKQASNDLKWIVQALYEEGFTEAALLELEALYRRTHNQYVKRATAWELLFWHANKQTKVGAKQALLYFFDACHGETDEAIFVQKAIVVAECLLTLGWNEEANDLLQLAYQVKPNANILLAKANAGDSMQERVAYINDVLAMYELEPIVLEQNGKIPYENLSVKIDEVVKREEKVSIIVPTYNAEDLVHVALDSLLKQTWKNIEIIVVDDCSSDGTWEIVKQYETNYPQIKVFSTPVNSGAYTARNIGLQHTTGDFITINDADDWSHPRKIEVQMNHLLANEDAIANTSTLSRVTENLYVYRRGTRGKYLFSNMSSLLFRKAIVQEKLGFWDAVRFAADGEFKRRLIHAFGKEAIVDLTTGPLSLPLQSENSLTANSAFGYHGAFIGARKEYVESFEHYYQDTKNVYYPFPTENRLFPVPKPMEPTYKKGKRFIDIVLVADFTKVTTNEIQLIEKEIGVHKRKGLKTGLVHMPLFYKRNKKEKIRPELRQLIDGNDVQMLVYGEDIKTNLLIIHHCRSLEVVQKHLPKLEVLSSLIIVDEMVQKEYNESSYLRLRQLRNNHMHYFNTVGNWYYASDTVAQYVQKRFRNELKYIPFKQDNWLIDGLNYEDIYEQRIENWLVQSID